MLPKVRSPFSLLDVVVALGARRDPDPLTTFEARFAEAFGFPHGLFFPYARTALQALVRALGRPGAPVACPAYLCAVVPQAIVLAGSSVRYVDSSPVHFLPGNSEWAAGLTLETELTVVAPVFGYPIEPDTLGNIRHAAPRAFLLTDEAQSFGAACGRGRLVDAADGALFSFGLGKLMSSVHGGMILLRDPALSKEVAIVRREICLPAAAIHTLRLTALALAAWAAFREPLLSAVEAVAQFGDQGWEDGSRAERETALPRDRTTLPAPFQGRMGLRQLAELSEILEGRRRIGTIYEERLRAAGIPLFSYSVPPTWPRYPLATANRPALIAAMRRQGIQLGRFLCFANSDVRSTGVSPRQVCPNATRWGKAMTNLPNFRGMTAAQAHRVADAVLRVRDAQPGLFAIPARVDGAA